MDFVNDLFICFHILLLASLLSLPSVGGDGLPLLFDLRRYSAPEYAGKGNFLPGYVKDQAAEGGPPGTLRIGLLPKDRVEEIKPIGNAALGGAAMLLLNKNLKEKCDLIAKTAIHVDLASSPAFSEFFMKDMMF